MDKIDEAIAEIVAYAFDEVPVPGGIVNERAELTRQYRDFADAILLQARVGAAELIVNNVHKSARVHDAPQVLDNSRKNLG